MGCDIGSGPNDAELDFKRRIEAMRNKLSSTPLSDFTADYAPDICLVMQGLTFTDYTYPVDRALKRLEELFSKRT